MWSLWYDLCDFYYLGMKWKAVVRFYSRRDHILKSDMHYLFMIKTTAAEIGALSLLHRLKELSSEKEKIKRKDGKTKKNVFFWWLCAQRKWNFQTIMRLIIPMLRWRCLHLKALYQKAFWMPCKNTP